MERCIASAKRLIAEQVSRNRASYGISFNTYNKSYCWTNENIKGYLNLVDFNGKENALSVLASGDHAFNLVYNGIKNVDTFDVNRLTEYIALGLKRAMILKYSYQDFLIVMKNLCSYDSKVECIYEIIEGLLPYMEEKHSKFWQEIIKFNYIIQKENSTNINLIHMLTVNFTESYDYIRGNSYLKNEEAYNKLKLDLLNAKINFKNVNALDLSQEFNGKYDLVLLSNILDYFGHYWGSYWDYETLKNYTEKLENITNKDAIIFLNYLFVHPQYAVTLFDDSTIKTDDLETEEIITLDDDSSGVILKRVK